MTKVALIALVIIVTDQVTKAVFPPPPCPQCSAGPELLNDDFGLGYIPGGGRPVYIAVMLAIVVVATFAPPVARVFLVAGGVGNLIDLVVLGGVRDWLPVPLAYVNIADLAILAGVLLWAFSSQREEEACSVTPSSRQR